MYAFSFCNFFLRYMSESVYKTVTIVLGGSIALDVNLLMSVLYLFPEKSCVPLCHSSIVL